jgi:hypothetical protein
LASFGYPGINIVGFFYLFSHEIYFVSSVSICLG